MTPDSDDTRLRKLEQTVAKLEQRTDDLSTEVRALIPLVVAVAEIKIGMENMRGDVHDLTAETNAVKRAMEDDKKDRRERQEAASRDGTRYRRTLLAQSFLLLAAIVTAAGAIIAAGVGP